MLTAEKKVGRLIELRVRGTVGAAELAQFRGHMIDVLRGLAPDERVVALADFRGVPIVPAALAEATVTLLRATNARLERGAVVIADQPLVRMQGQRMLDEAHHQGRKLCVTVDEAIEWLRPSLTPAELARARRFLDEG